jgi:hypothetical protein
MALYSKALSSLRAIALFQSDLHSEACSNFCQTLPQVFWGAQGSQAPGSFIAMGSPLSIGHRKLLEQAFARVFSD